MAGTSADRELSTRFAVATSADDEAIRLLLRKNPMGGAISLSFEREPGYFRGSGFAGGEDKTIIAYSSDGSLLCVGRCTRRELWICGAARNVGYLAELRLDASASGRFSILRDGYRFFHALERDDPATLYFTSIAADNTRARRLLESGARGLPSYDFLAELDTLLVSVPNRPPVGKLRVERATPERIPEMIRLLNAPRHHFSMVWTEENLRPLAAHGLPLERFFLAIEGNEIIACGAIWDQRAWRQTVIRGYSRSLAAARPMLNLASRIFGTPRLPPVDSAVSHVILSPLALARGAEDALPDFAEALFPHVAEIGAEFLTLALPATDALLPVLRRRFSTRTWRSRLYQVEAPGRRIPFSFEGPIHPDVALL